jgi:ATP-dependent Clp protease ATP-binding subunit ClpC
MFERFTEQSRRAVVLAQEEARLLNHNYIGADHLLLGLIHEGQGPAALALAAAGVTLDAAREQVVAVSGRGQEPRTGHIPFTPAVKKSLELSLAEATAAESYHIGTGHLLLGLIREGDNPAVQVLAALGADPADLRARVAGELGEHPDQVTPVRRTWVTSTDLGLFLRSTLPGLLTTIEQRLTTIEQHLGLTPAERDEPPGNVVPPS